MEPAAAELAAGMLKACAASRVRQISRVVTARYDACLRDRGITTNQLTILCLIVARGPSRSVDLEPHLAMEQSTLSRTLRRMLEHGWIERRPDDDRRCHLVAATDEGVALIRRAHDAWSDAQAWIRDRLGPESLEGLDEVARKLNPDSL